VIYFVSVKSKILAIFGLRAAILGSKLTFLRKIEKASDLNIQHFGGIRLIESGIWRPDPFLF